MMMMVVCILHLLLFILSFAATQKMQHNGPADISFLLPL